MDEDARISWNINLSNNVDFIPPKVHSKGKNETAKDEGTTYKKLLCVAFDLAVLCSYNNESYFRFIYHDDVLSQQDNGIKIRLLELVKELTKKYDLQYVLSVIKSDNAEDFSISWISQFLNTRNFETSSKSYCASNSGSRNKAIH